MLDRTKLEERHPLGCLLCNEVVLATTEAVLVCEGCLGRYHRACWAGHCEHCGEAHAFTVVPDAPSAVPMLAFLPGEKRLPHRRLAHVTAGALAGLGLIAFLVASPERKTLAPIPAAVLPATSASTEAARFLDRALALRAAGDLRGAIAEATRAVELDPLLTAAWFQLGLDMGDLGVLGPSIAAYTRVLDLEPVGPWAAAALNNRGFVRGLADDFERALADATAALAMDPQSAYSWNNRGYARTHLGDLEGAATGIARSLALDPKNPYAWENRGHLRLRQGDLTGATEDFRRSLATDVKKQRVAAVRATLLDLGIDPDAPTSR